MLSFKPLFMPLKVMSIARQDLISLSNNRIAMNSALIEIGSSSYLIKGFCSLLFLTFALTIAAHYFLKTILFNIFY